MSESSNYVAELREAIAAVREMPQRFQRLANVPAGTDAEALFQLLRDEIGYSPATKSSPLLAAIDNFAGRLCHTEQTAAAALRPLLAAAEAHIGSCTDKAGAVIRTGPIKDAISGFSRKLSPLETVIFHAVTIDLLPEGHWLRSALLADDFYQARQSDYPNGKHHPPGPRLIVGWGVTGAPVRPWYALAQALSITRSWRETQREREAVEARQAAQVERERQERLAQDPAHRLRQLEKAVAAMQGNEPAPVAAS